MIHDIIPFLKNNDFLGFPDSPGRGASRSAPKKMPLLFLADYSGNGIIGIVARLASAMGKQFPNLYLLHIKIVKTWGHNPLFDRTWRDCLWQRIEDLIVP